MALSPRLITVAIELHNYGGVIISCCKNRCSHEWVLHFHIHGLCDSAAA
jgi:hypothetical protein